MKPQKAFAQHLTYVPKTDKWHSEWILKGSEGMARYPKHTWPGGNETKGIITFGTKKINGQTCVSIGSEDAHRAEQLGWKVVSIGTAYAYIIR